MRFPTPTPLRAAAALAASVALAGCSFFTGIPDVDRVEVSVAPRVINVNQTAVAFGTAYNGNSVVRHSRRQVIFRSDNEAVATVNPSSGQIVGLSVGVAHITGSSGGKSDMDSVIVRLVPARSVVFTRRSPRFRVGATNALTATALDSLNNALARTIQYRSADEAVLTIAPNGVVTPRAPGTTLVIASVDNGLGGGPTVADTVTATVTLPPITGMQLTPLQANRVAGETQQFQVALTDSLGATVTGRPITWVSNNLNVARVDATGLVTTLAPGSATIAAITDRVPGEPAQVSDQAVINVLPAASATTTSNLASVSLRLSGPTTVVLAVDVRDAGGNVIVGRAIRATGFDPNVVQVTFNGAFSQATVSARTAGTTTITLQARDATNQLDQGTPTTVQVTVAP